LRVMLARLALPTLPVLPGAILCDSIESDVDDRMRHPIDPGKRTATARPAAGNS